VDLARGTFLRDGDGDGPGARADVQDATVTAVPVYRFEGGVHDALCVGARYQGVFV
jgi:hypothetical protein